MCPSCLGKILPINSLDFEGYLNQSESKDQFEFFEDILEIPKQHLSYDTDYNLHLNTHIACAMFTPEDFIDRNFYSRTQKILSLNIRSVPKNLENLELFLSPYIEQISVIALTETWLDKTTVDLYNFGDFHGYHSVRFKKKGGGVSLYIRTNIPVITLDGLKTNSVDIESVFIRIPSDTLVEGEGFIFGSIYRAPSGNIEDFLEVLVKFLNFFK